MDARIFRVAILAAAAGSLGASYRTANFIIEAPTPQLAEQIGRSAEAYRRDLAIEWLGKALPNWSAPCPVVARVDERLGAGGATSFQFIRGEVVGWQMNIQGPQDRLLDSVLPHEVTHTIFASYFRRPLPRWADEGACTTVEHVTEKSKQQKMLIHFLQNGRGIAFNQMFAMKEYPADVLPLYSQGFSLARFLIEQGGRQKFLQFVADGLEGENWGRATKKHYGYNDLAMLQNTWLEWVKQGSPQLAGNGPQIMTVAADTSNQAQRRQRPEPNLIYRGQSEDSAPDTTRLAQVGAPPVPQDSSMPSRYSGAANRLPVSPAPQQTTIPQGPPQTAHDAGPGRPGEVILEWRRED